MLGHRKTTFGKVSILGVSNHVNTCFSMMTRSPPTIQTYMLHMYYIYRLEKKITSLIGYFAIEILAKTNSTQTFF